MENRGTFFIRTVILVSFLFSMASSVAYGQEPTETAPEESITEEATVTTPESTESAVSPNTAISTPRHVSQKDILELEAAMEVLSRADAVVQHILQRIIIEYKINAQTENLNLKTGAIQPR